MLKSLCLEESPAKEKHVRTLVIGTYRTHGPSVFWRKLQDCVPLYSNDIVCWKFLVVFHRVLQEGHANCLKGSMQHCQFIGSI
jgi:hypothetical protein